VFGEFLESNRLTDLVLNLTDEAEIHRHFQAARFPAAVTADLVRLLELVRYPLAVRSSSLLEDSQYQPFAGIYETHMVANQELWAAVRLDKLTAAIKRVYASTFAQRARAYLHTISYRLEEERMAVMLQKLAGAWHGNRFYPHVSGVARSHNVYPLPPARAEDGIAAVALGFGETVASGRPCLRFCPRHPRHVIHSSARDFAENSQHEFHALAPDHPDDATGLTLFDLSAALEDGTLADVASTYSTDDDRLHDGLSRAGVPVVTFAPMLKLQKFPLAQIVTRLLEITQEGVDGPVELEFAVTLAPDDRAPHEFSVLQLRPLALTPQGTGSELGEIDASNLICMSDRVAGNGRLEVHDVIVVDYDRFERRLSRDVARDVARFNARLSAAGIPFVLIGVGRWGSADPYLGIPVSWDEINGARAIVEAGFKDIRITPSQGTHFFQNLVASGVSYFTVNVEAGEGTLDWEWLGAQVPVEASGCVRHLHFDAPVVVIVDGRTRRGVIVKPGQ
jgi:hypothetical protein